MTRTLVLVPLGLLCLCISGWLMYLQLPREHRAPPAWMTSGMGESVASLGWFVLVALGISLIIKGIP